MRSSARARALSSSIRAALLLSAALAATEAGAVSSDRGKPQSTAAIPLPPPRPADLFGRGTELSARSVPDSLPPAASVAVMAVSRALPFASRERMHDCGLEWQRIKSTGTAGERTWRDFALTCLPR